MPSEISNKVDIVSWLITVSHPWQPETQDHWDNPSVYPFMREVLHESVHFWQAVGIPYFLRISFEAYRDFQRVRASAVEQSIDNRPVPMDRLRLEENRIYFSGYQRLNRTYGDLAGADIIEGLARYWDIHLCGAREALNRFELEGRISTKDIAAAQLNYGPFYLPDGNNYTDALLNYLFEVETRYNIAYRYIVERIGREAFILFPVLGFLALSAGRMSVSKFQNWVNRFADERPFAIQRGNFILVWNETFKQAFNWITKDLGEPVYSSLTVYRKLSKKMASWSLSSSLARRFGLMASHGVLDRYMRNYGQWVKHDHPELPDEDVELHINPAFCFPGNPIYRELLARNFHPPVILFSEGKAWVDEVNWQNMSDKLSDELSALGAMLGAAMAISGEFGKKFAVRCPHLTCPWHRTQVCWKVRHFPDKAENCHLPQLYRSQLSLDLPTDADWHVGKIDRLSVNERESLLAVEDD